MRIVEDILTELETMQFILSMILDEERLRKRRDKFKSIIGKVELMNLSIIHRQIMYKHSRKTRIQAIPGKWIIISCLNVIIYHNSNLFAPQRFGIFMKFFRNPYNEIRSLTALTKSILQLYETLPLILNNNNNNDRLSDLIFEDTTSLFPEVSVK